MSLPALHAAEALAPGSGKLDLGLRFDGRGAALTADAETHLTSALSGFAQAEARLRDGRLTGDGQLGLRVRW